MKVSDFDYQLPEELIAQEPLQKRSSSNLLVVDRKTQTFFDKKFYQILDYLNKGDVLVLNNTKVLPARIYGKKIDTSAKIEVLLLEEIEDYWEVLVRPFKRVKVGTVLNFNNLFMGRVIRKLKDGICWLKFEYKGIFLNLLEQLGKMPLPPYIHQDLDDQSRYQTIFAKTPGSAAAPTAGLHFDEQLLEAIKAKGVEILSITLQIGLGTFRSVQVEEVSKHKMHSEFYSMSQEVANRLNKAKQDKRRIICVGTTSVRTLEAIFKKHKKFIEVSEKTDIFIYPGYEFKAVDALITNFHLPKSTLLMLVSAFYEKNKIMDLYKYAIEKEYRFFSFGDAMLII